MLIIKGGLIHNAIEKEPFIGDIMIQDGKIVEILREGEECVSVMDAKIIEASGLEVYPGFVEAHGHIGLDGYGIGYEGKDYNEMGDIACPQMRGMDGVKAMDPAFALAREAGVTCVCTGPGSANVLGGTFTVVKTVGCRVENMMIKEAAAMKCAFGENPKRCYRDKGNSTRMSTAAKLREMLFKAREYGEKLELAKADPGKKPAFDMKMEALQPVIRGEMPLKAHAHATEDRKSVV